MVIKSGWICIVALLFLVTFFCFICVWHCGIIDTMSMFCECESFLREHPTLTFHPYTVKFVMRMCVLNFISWNDFFNFYRTLLIHIPCHMWQTSHGMTNTSHHGHIHRPKRTMQSHTVTVTIIVLYLKLPYQSCMCSVSYNLTFIFSSLFSLRNTSSWCWSTCDWKNPSPCGKWMYVT